MYQVHVNPVEHPDGFEEFHAGSYRKLMQELGISLLDSSLSKDSDFMRICDETDNKTEHWITIDNYILGDTSDPNFQDRRSSIFVAHGIRYTLSGQVSKQTLKQIVDSMQ